MLQTPSLELERSRSAHTSEIHQVEAKMKWDALAVSVCLGLCSLAAINLTAPEYTAGITKIAQTDGSSSALEPVYTFLRLVSTFFRDSASGPLGVPVWYTLIGLAAPGQLLLAVEANRHGSGGLLAWYTFFAVLLQVLGIGVVVPLLWIPTYLIHWRKSASAATPAGSWALSARQVWVIGGSLWLGLAPALGAYQLMGTPELQSAATAVFTFLPTFVAPLWWMVGRRSKTAAAPGPDAVHAAVDGASATIAHYNAAAGIGVALWALTLVHVAANFSDLSSAVAAALRDPAGSPSLAASVILAADAAGLWLSLVLFAAIEDGWTQAARVLAGSAIVGPGAAVALYLANVRERRIGLAAMQSLRKVE